MEDFEVKFIYRVYNKTIEGGQLESIKDRVFEKYSDCVFSIGENTYWPVAPSDVDHLREKGILLTEMDGQQKLVTQEVIGTIFQDSYESATHVATDLQNVFPGEFAIMQIITNWKTEVFAK